MFSTYADICRIYLKNFGTVLRVDSYSFENIICYPVGYSAKIEIRRGVVNLIIKDKVLSHHIPYKANLEEFFIRNKKLQKCTLRFKDLELIQKTVAPSIKCKRIANHIRFCIETGDLLVHPNIFGYTVYDTVLEKIVFRQSDIKDLVRFLAREFGCFAWSEVNLQNTLYKKYKVEHKDGILHLYNNTDLLTLGVQDDILTFDYLGRKVKMYNNCCDYEFALKYLFMKASGYRINSYHECTNNCTIIETNRGIFKIDNLIGFRDKLVPYTNNKDIINITDDEDMHKFILSLIYVDLTNRG